MAMLESARPSWRVRVARWLLHRAAKPVLLLTLCGPLAWLCMAAFTDRLGANPAEALIRSTGDWTLRLLCLTLAVTPLRERLGLPALARFRRMLGVSVFAYASLHLSAYSWLDLGLEWTDLWADVVKRPFITVGMAAWVMLLPLALTSFNAAIRRLGAERWRRLHRLVYGIAVLAVLHFWWMRSGKHDYAEVMAYAAVLTTLLGARLLAKKRVSA